MYRAHFGLKELPFTITPNTSFFFAHSSHREALNTLLVAVRSGEGFIKVTGEVGTGKTMLCRKFLDLLERENCITAYIPNPCIGPSTLLLGTADELEIDYPKKVNRHQLFKLLTNFLLDASTQGRRVVLCLDEAQAMPVETLEALRLLTNLETERRKLLQVVLFGQPELNNKLNKRVIRQLKQRITFSCTLVPLALSDVDYYLAHRLGIAGFRGSRLFTTGAVKELYKASRGIPRLINILAHKAMLLAFGEGQHHINDKHIRLACADTESIRQSTSLRARLYRYFTALSTSLMISLAIVFWGD
jgi:MSHA biogenesis protein MshM